VRANDTTGASPHQRRLHINANGALTNSAATKTFNTNALLQTNHGNDASDANYAFT
jgi:O-glycosyl hydrolase